MNLGTIEITPEEATERLAEIEAVIDRNRTAEDVALAQAYRAAKRGHGVISLRRAIELGGVFPSGRPKIAIAPTTALRCRVDVSWREDNFQFSDADINTSSHRRNALVGANHVNVSVTPMEHSGKVMRSGETIVPLIPARFRPKPRNLKHCHILWEVERWDPTPPIDPALVKHIRGDLWAVLATWDLTELERLVLTQRA